LEGAGDEVGSDEASEGRAGGETAPVPTERKLPARIQYRVALTRDEVIEQFEREGSIGVFSLDTLPDWADTREQKHRFTMEVDGPRFQIHYGPPAARGQSGTGLLRLLYMAGSMERTSEGTQIDLRFVFSRPRWAGQRRVGFLALLVGASFWVFLGGGDFYQRLLFFLGFLLVTSPAVVHDLRRGKRIESEKVEMLSLVERVLGPVSLEDGQQLPYRKRQG
jgi:hypothetical protein